MFEGVVSASVAAFAFYQADQIFFDGQHVEALPPLAQRIANSFGV
jgi:hypothetical protein